MDTHHGGPDRTYGHDEKDAAAFQKMLEGLQRERKRQQYGCFGFVVLAAAVTAGSLYILLKVNEKLNAPKPSKPTAGLTAKQTKEDFEQSQRNRASTLYHRGPVLREFAKRFGMTEEQAEMELATLFYTEKVPGMQLTQFMKAWLNELRRFDPKEADKIEDRFKRAADDADREFLKQFELP